VFVVGTWAFQNNSGIDVVDDGPGWAGSRVFYFKRALINSGFPQHMDVLPFSMGDKLLKMEKKGKSYFPFFVL